MANLVPVVYLAFANELDDYLAELKNESRAIFKALRGLEKEGKIRVHREESSQVDELHQDLLAYDQDIVIFHYGGHADGGMLQLEGGRGNAGGLAKMLGQQKNLKLVFLNGCATKDQVELLHSAGIPAVIATSVKINDSKATIFSTAFYESLVKGHSIEESFESARNLLETKFADDDIFDISFNRFPEWGDDEELEQDEVHQGLEWALYTREDAQDDIDQWRLISAQAEWQVQLRDAQGVIRSVIDDEPLTIMHRSVQRNLSAGVCIECGTTLLKSKKGERASNTCPLCLNETLEKGVTATSLPDQIIDFSISEKQASSISSQAFEAILTKDQKHGDLTIEPPVAVWAPYWKFDANLVVDFEGESALPTGIADGKPKLDWQSRSDRLDKSIASYLVPASKSSVAKVDIDEPEMKAARDYDSDDSLQLSLTTDKNIEEAFMEASLNVNGYLDAEIKERLGGVEQRNVKSTTRYDNVAANLVWLPRWLVSAKLQDNTTALIVDGQTGSVDIPRLSGISQLNDEVKNIMGQKTFSVGADISKANLIASVFGGVGIGLMVGLLLGLAGPSEPGEQKTVSIFVGALGVILAALLGLNDRHFSIAKGLRIGSFGFAVCIAAMSGIFIRDYGLLTPGSDKYSVAHYEHPTAGSTSSDGQAVTVVKTTVVAAGSQGKSYLFSSSVNLDSCSEIRHPNESTFSPAVMINNFKLSGDKGWADFALAVDNQISEPQKKLALLNARDSICGYQEFQNPIKVESDACAPLMTAIKGDELGEVETVFDQFGIQNVFKRVADTMTKPDAIKTLNLVVGMLCANREK